MLADNSLVFNGLLAELIQIKKGSGKDFYTKTDNSYNHFMEVPIGNSAPDNRPLTKKIKQNDTWW